MYEYLLLLLLVRVYIWGICRQRLIAPSAAAFGKVPPLIISAIKYVAEGIIFGSW